MKWIFAILVALNLVVFASTVFQSADGNAGAEADPFAGGFALGLGANEYDIVNFDEEDRKAAAAAQSADAAKAESAAETAPSPKGPEPAASAKKPAKREGGEADRGAVAKAGRDRPAELDPARDKAATGSSEGCAAASVELPEEVYHRIKGLLNQFPNAATRKVVPNENAGHSAPAPSSYWVIANGSARDGAFVAALRERGLNPQLVNGSIVLGRFNNSAAAEHIRSNLAATGLSTRVEERASAQRAPLSAVRYRVAFQKLNEDQSEQVRSIVSPYATLRVNKCRSESSAGR